MSTLTLDKLKEMQDMWEQVPAIPEKILVNDLQQFQQKMSEVGGNVSMGLGELWGNMCGIDVRLNPHVPENKAVMVYPDGTIKIVEFGEINGTDDKS